MKTAKLVIGIISMVLFVLVAFQSCAAGLGNALADNGEVSGTSGMLLAFCMTIITTEIQKWKRNKIVWCILALTLLLGAFAIERACSISRSSPFMDSFGDLYTLAFKNLSSLFLPIVLGMFATTLFFDEHKGNSM